MKSARNAPLSSPRHLIEKNFSWKTQSQICALMGGDEFQNFKICIQGDIFEDELVEVEEKGEGKILRKRKPFLRR